MAEVPDVSPGARASEASASPATSTSSTTSHSAGTPRSATGSRDTSAVAAASSPNTGDPPITPTPSVTVPALQQILAVLAAGTAVATDPAVTVAQVTARLAPGGTTLSTRVARLRPILPKPTLHGHKTDPLNLKSVCVQLAPGSGSIVTPALTGSCSSASNSNGAACAGTAVRIATLNYPTPSTLSSCSSPTQSQLSDFDIPSPLSMSDRSTPLDFSPTVDVVAARSDENPREGMAPKNLSQRTRAQSANQTNGSHKPLLGDRVSAFMGTGFPNRGTTQSSTSGSCPPLPDQFIATRGAPPEFIDETPIALEANRGPPRGEITRTPAQAGHEHVNLDELRYTTLGEVLSARASPSASSPSNSSVALQAGLHTPPPSECAVEAPALGQPQMLSSRSHSLHSLNFQPNNGHIETAPGFDSLLCATPGPAEHRNSAGGAQHGPRESSSVEGSGILPSAIYMSQLM